MPLRLLMMDLTHPPLCNISLFCVKALATLFLGISPWSPLPFAGDFRLAPTRASRAQDRLDDPSLFRVLGSLVDLVKRIELQHFVEGETPLRIEVYQLGDEDVRNGIPFNDAANRPAVQDILAIEADPAAEGRDTDQTAHAGEGETIEGLAEHVRYARAFQGVVGPVAGNPLDLFDGICLARIDEVRGAQLLGRV